MKFFISSHLHKVCKHGQCVYLASRLFKLFELLSEYVGDSVLRPAILSSYYAYLHPETLKDIDNVRQPDQYSQS